MSDPNPSIADELAKLADLHSGGALTDDEFAAAKARLLGGGVSSSQVGAAGLGADLAAAAEATRDAALQLAAAEGHPPGTATAAGLFDVWLTAAGPKKIGVIKAIREINGLGLKEAKDLADKTPSGIVGKVTSDQAAEATRLIESAGGTVQVVPHQGP